MPWSSRCHGRRPGEMGKYSIQVPWSSRCQVPYKDYLVHAFADEAIVAILKFTADAGYEMHLFFQDVGTNQSMQILLRSAGVCWDWQKLVVARPEKYHVKAFLELCKLLRPVSVHWELPLEDEFANVPKRRVTDYSTKGNLAWQYVVLLARVRDAAAQAAGRIGAQQRLPEEVLGEARKWIKACHVRAAPLIVFVEVQFLLGAALWLGRSNYCLCTGARK